ncbi:glycosyltransferase family 2 protein [Lentilactobacillus otakiensis]|uniref:glycosyltransferase family 2 protein n=1 Tax=Lentilactobacillus otakiensis TaxID=481720 RepID=UPI003D178C43
MDKHQELISIVLPVYNEEPGIETTIDTLEKFAANQPQNFEFIFVDDGSTDKSAKLIQDNQAYNQNIRLVEFSRNFGHQLAITAGIRYTQGDAVVVMDADLQDPPAVIVDMIAKWHQGYDVVYGKRLSRDGESIFKKATAALFYRGLKHITNVNIPLDTGDFRLMDKQVVYQLRQMNEADPFVRGMVSWVGFKQTDVTYERQERIAGTSKYPLRKMIRLAMDGVTSFSSFPLQLANWLGTFSIIFGIGYLITSLFTTMDTIHFAVFALFLMVGITLLTIGMLGSYLYRVFEASRRRPLYIVAKTVEFRTTRDQKSQQTYYRTTIKGRAFQQ